MSSAAPGVAGRMRWVVLVLAGLVLLGRSAEASVVSPIRTFQIDNASRRLEFRIAVGGDCEHGTCAGPATLTVLRQKSHRILQRIRLANVELVLTEKGRPLVNGAVLYDDQGTINVGDFNFDGREDFAVQVGSDGPYGSSTFRVFLQSPCGRRFVRSRSLSRLTEENLGFFQVDARHRRLVTLAKSGCCYHVLRKWAVVRNTAVLVYWRLDDATKGDRYVYEITERRVGKRWIRSMRRVKAAR